MVSYYNFKTKESGYAYDIGKFLSFYLGDNYYEYDCSLNIKIKEDSLEYELYIMNFDFAKGEYEKIKIDYPTPEFKSKNEILNFFNKLINKHDCDFFGKIRHCIVFGSEDE